MNKKHRSLKYWEYTAMLVLHQLACTLLLISLLFPYFLENDMVVCVIKRRMLVHAAGEAQHYLRIPEMWNTISNKSLR